MKYICSVCRYVYDEEKEGTPFSELPESWVCPLCGAARSAFVPEEGEERPAPAVKPAAAPVHEGDEEMKELSFGALAALCSNLARGCEKQYKAEESALFLKLAEYFTAASPAPARAGLEELDGLLSADLAAGYPALRTAADEEGDRGTACICVWGEKVTAILHTLMQRYNREGDAFLRDTRIWVCSICGFVYVGDRPPALCPVCKVPAWKLEEVEGRASK